MAGIITDNSPFSVLKIPEFKSLMTGRFLFIMGLRMMATLVGWWIYELTDQPFAIGLIGLAEVIPALSLALYAGHIIDLSEKRKLLLLTVFCYFVCAGALLFFAFGLNRHYFSGSFVVIAIYVIIFCTGIVRSFTGPNFNVLLATIVDKPRLARAITWNQAVWLSASVLGHAAGGFFIAWFGVQGTLVAICLFIAAAWVVLSRLQKRAALNKKGEQRTWESVKEGLRFVFRTPVILGALSLDMFAVLFGGAKAMVPVFAKDILHVGADGFGLLNAATDIGSIIIIMLLAFIPMKKAQGYKLLFSVAGFGICIIVFAISRSFWLSFLALMISGILDGVSMVVRGTILQLQAPDHMRGRVMSVNSMFVGSSNELGQFESGLAARLLGVIPSVIFGGSMTILTVLVTWIKAPTLKKFEY